MNVLARDMTEGYFIYQKKKKTPLVSKIHLKTYSSTATSPIKKWGEDLNGHFCKDGIQMADKRMKKDAQHC